MSGLAVGARFSRPEPDPLDALSPREHEVLAGIAEGLSVGEIAARLGTSQKTVESQRRVVYWKLGVHKATEAAWLAERAGVLE